MTAPAAEVIGLVVALRLFGMSPGISATTSPRTATVELRLTTYAALDAANVALARHTANTLLASAGLAAAWIDCGLARDHCSVAADNAFPVHVRLLPIAKKNDGTVCGEATRDALTEHPTVLVYVPRSRELVLRIQHTAAGRANPLLSTLQAGHIVGLTIAHEVGHVLRLPHGPQGVMKAHPTLDDIVALRSSGLGFGAKEIAQMQRALDVLAARLNPSANFGR